MWMKSFESILGWGRCCGMKESWSETPEDEYLYSVWATSRAIRCFAGRYLVPFVSMMACITKGLRCCGKRLANGFKRKSGHLPTAAESPSLLMKRSPFRGDVEAKSYSR